MFYVEQIVGGIVGIPVRSFNQLVEAVRYAKFLNDCNNCWYVVKDDSFRILYDTKAVLVTDGWQKLGF